MSKAAKDHDGSSQIDTFVKTARALGCDEDREKFEGTLRKIASHKPSKPQRIHKSKLEGSKE